MPNPSTTTEAPASNKEKKTAYLICEGALCECDAGSAKVKLKVTSHKKAYINENKLVATEKDVTFDSPGNFGTCSFMTSPYNTCAPKVQQWLQPYNDIEVENNKVITDKSELKCKQYDGTITILKPGQTQDVNAEQANNMDRSIAVQVNALADLAPIAEEDKKVSVLSITGKLVDDPKYKPVTTQENQSIISIAEKERLAHKQIDDPADIYVRPGQEVKFVAKPDGTESLVCWKVSGTKDSVYFLQHGPTYQSSFPEVGKYSIEGYGTGKDSYLDIETRLVNGERVDRKEYKDCMLDILVQENKLVDIRHLQSKNIIDVTNKNLKEKAQLRIGVPATFEPVFIMPPIQKEIDELILVVIDESETELQRTKGEPHLVFVPKNSAAKYTIKAYFEGAEAAFVSYPFASSLNSVNVIATSNMKVENEKIRPGTFMKFTVQNSKFMDDTVAPEIIETENTQIKWYENSETIAGTGPSYENTYQKEDKYKIVCRVSEGKPGWFNKGKNENDDWHFEVTKNYPTAIEKTTTGISKIGRKISFELKGIFKIDTSDKNTIHWRLIGPETKETPAASTFDFTPTKKGTYKLYVSMNGRSTKDPFEFECTACEIVKGWWTDSDGNMLTGNDNTSDPSNTLGVAGWGQEVCVAFKHIGLGGEVVTIEVWDKDFNGTTSVYTTELTCTEGYNAVKCPLILDGDLKKNVAKKGASSNGLLYFTVTVKNGLKVVNNGMTLPLGEINYLKVDDTLRAKAYFADNNDTKRYSTASTDMPVYVQVKSTNLINEDLEIVVHKTICWGISKPYKEKVTFRVDKYGMASVKLDMCIFNEEFSNPNDSITLFVNVYKKSNSKELYSSDGKYPLTLYEKLNTSPAAKNTTKAFVMVDTSEGVKNECECKLNNFAWGNKLTCQERKKILSICSKLWGDANKVDRADELMSIIHLESAGTFNPSVDNGAGYSGLIQFSDAAAKSIGTTRVDLKKMSFLQQLDYVEKYFIPHKEKLKTITDLYLLVLKPNAVGNGINPDYIIFDESISVPNLPYNKDNLYKEPWTTKYGYTSNPTFMLEKDESVKRLHMTYTKGELMRPGFINGKTYVKEITQVLNEQHLKPGLLNIFSGFCEDETKNRNDISLKNRAAWMSIAVSKATEAKGSKEGGTPMYSMAKSYLKYCGNTFEPTDSDNGPWCAAFMNWCIGQSINPLTKVSYEHSKSASSLAPIDAELGLKYKKIDYPIFGCIVVYKHIYDWRGHTGFLYGKTEGGDYILLGGNQDDTIRFDSYGEYTSSTKKKKIYGFYIPKDYEITDYDKLTAQDTYKDAEVVNSKYKINSLRATGKTN